MSSNSPSSLASRGLLASALGPEQRDSRPQRWLWIGAGSVAALGAAPWQGPAASPWESEVAQGVTSMRVEALNVFARGMTVGGAYAFVSFLTLLIAFASFRRSARAALRLVVSVIGAGLISRALKVWVARPRPALEAMIDHASGHSFPSGHATSALAFALALLFWNRDLRAAANPRWLQGLAALYVLLIGWTRVYLGVHYPTDVIAGYGIALAWVLAVHWAWARWLPAGRFARRLVNEGDQRQG